MSSLSEYDDFSMSLSFDDDFDDGFDDDFDDDFDDEEEDDEILDDFDDESDLYYDDVFKEEEDIFKLYINGVRTIDNVLKIKYSDIFTDKLSESKGTISAHPVAP